ncbi:MAG: HD domain-containing protein [Methanomassiliicoccaceae archaeon]|jgi:putative hydrolase of HD superfamily|nr:HD domain-containing protein [Methanomassiliicoccaceae archaeon]
MEMRKAMNMDLIYNMFDAANMRRWNDHLRPADLTELDKQAHKMVIAWVLGKFEESEGKGKIDWRKLIERAMFSFIRRTILTDLKPQLFHRVVIEKEKEMNDFVLREFDARVPEAEKKFRERFISYLKRDTLSKEDRILKAAHYLATSWEFKLVYNANPSMYGIDRTKGEIEKQIKEYADVSGVIRLFFGKDTFDFIDLCGQLRFQQRWARVPRIPQTTVLGHMLMVANMVYLHDVDMKADDASVYTNYFTALFHDLPEVLTKDVISPIKRSIDGLDELLSEYEREMVSSSLLPLLPKEWHSEFLSLIDDPFGGPGGTSVKVCDLFAAYMEAHVSECYGISSRSLSDGKEELKAKLLSMETDVDVKGLLERLDSMRI